MSRILLLLATVLLLSGCGGWEVIDHRSSSAIDASHLEGKWVRATSLEGTEQLRVTRVVFPYLDGFKRGEAQERSIHLRKVDRLELRTGYPRSAASGLGAAGILSAFRIGFAVF